MGDHSPHYVVQHSTLPGLFGHLPGVLVPDLALHALVPMQSPFFPPASVHESYVQHWMFAAPAQWPAVDVPPLDEQAEVAMHSPSGEEAEIEHEGGLEP